MQSLVSAEGGFLCRAVCDSYQLFPALKATRSAAYTHMIMQREKAKGEGGRERQRERASEREREVERHTQRGNPISWKSSNITTLSNLQVLHYTDEGFTFSLRI